ncbi:hypothetical protein D9M70_479950 [compost metagenome]
MLVLGTDGHLVAATEGLHRQRDEAVQAECLDMGVVGVGDRPAAPGGRVHRIVGPGEVARRGLGVTVGERGLELAAVVQRVIDFREALPDALVHLVPLGVDEGGAAHIQQPAIGVGRQPEGRGGAVLLVGAAQRQRGARGQVVLQAAIGHRPLVLGVIDPGLVVFVGGDEAPAQAAVVVQRTGDVDAGVVAIV